MLREIDVNKNSWASGVLALVAAAFSFGVCTLGAAPAVATAPSLIQVAQAQETEPNLTPPPVQGKKHKKKHAAASSAVVAAESPQSQGETAPSGDTRNPILGIAILIAIVGGGITYLWFRIRSRRPKISGDGYIQADYTIPHCKFDETAEGFKVSFRRLPAVLSVEFAQRKAQTDGGGGLFVMIGVLIGTLFALLFGMCAWLWLLYRPTTIEVTKEAVIINGEKYRRGDFGTFHLDHTRQLHGKDEPIAVIAYTYGNRKFTFGGAWKESEAMRFLSSLNQRLRVAPKVGDEHQPAPEQLRSTAQPTDF
jgi:hypothetical protein